MVCLSQTNLLIILINTLNRQCRKRFPESFSHVSRYKKTMSDTFKGNIHLSKQTQRRHEYKKQIVYWIERLTWWGRLGYLYHRLSVLLPYYNYKSQEAITRSRHIPIILFNSHIPILIVFIAHLSLALCRYYLEGGYLLLQYTTSQATSKIQLSSEIGDISIFWSSIGSCNPTSAFIKKPIHTRLVILLPPIAFNLLSHPTKLPSYNHYPCFSIPMPFNQPGSSSTANIGIYNDVAGNQINIQGDVNGQYIYF